MKQVGFWYSTREPHFPMPVANSSKLSAADTEKLIVYLLVGDKNHYMGFSTCRICGKMGHEMGTADVSDGEWVWPEGLVHYIEEHRVALPDEFVNHVLASYKNDTAK